MFSFDCSLSIFLLLSVELFELIDCLLGGDCIFCRLLFESRNRFLVLLGSLTLSLVLFGFDGGFFGIFLLLGISYTLGFFIVPLSVSYACCFQLCDLRGVQFFELSNLVVVILSTFISSIDQFLDSLLFCSKSFRGHAALFYLLGKLSLGFFCNLFSFFSTLLQDILKLVCFFHVSSIHFD